MRRSKISEIFDLTNYNGSKKALEAAPKDKEVKKNI